LTIDIWCLMFDVWRIANEYRILNIVSCVTSWALRCNKIPGWGCVPDQLAGGIFLLKYQGYRTMGWFWRWTRFVQDFACARASYLKEIGEVLCVQCNSILNFRRKRTCCGFLDSRQFHSWLSRDARESWAVERLVETSGWITSHGMGEAFGGILDRPKGNKNGVNLLAMDVKRDPLCY
jgi:hypothetical protein